MNKKDIIYPFDNIETIRRKQDSNRRKLHEEKLALKIINRKFVDNPNDLNTWTNEVKETDYPLALLDDLLDGFKLYAVETVENLTTLLKTPTKTTLWKEYAETLLDVDIVAPGSHAALVFPMNLSNGNKKDFVIHNRLELSPPSGEFRIMRVASTGMGGIIIDTFTGFLSVLSEYW